MTTARFAVTLSVSTLPNAVVRKVLRRADANRAVSYAETWLRKSRLSGRYVMVWYDQWTVSEVNEGGEEHVIAHGKAKDTEEERLYSRATPKSVRKRAETPGRSVNVSVPSLLDMPHSRRGALSARVRKTPSGLNTKSSRSSQRRAGIAAMVENAKRRLADDE